MMRSQVQDQLHTECLTMLCCRWHLTAHAYFFESVDAAADESGDLMAVQWIFYLESLTCAALACASPLGHLDWAASSLLAGS